MAIIIELNIQKILYIPLQRFYIELSRASHYVLKVFDTIHLTREE